VNQRWLNRLATYRAPDEVIRTGEYEVAEIHGDAAPKAFVEQHHYSGTYPAARWRFGIWRLGVLEGVAVFSHPSNDRVLTNVFPCTAREAVELGRFVLLDSIPGNGETWFLARCFELLRKEGLFGVVSFSDPIARTSGDGARVFPGHIGTIYQAHNAAYLGRSGPSTQHLLPDGRAFSPRAESKIRRQEQGWRYCVEQLVRFGAPKFVEGEDPKEWLRVARGQLLRNLRHPGNHRYAWTMNKRDRKRLPPSQPYPKLPQVQIARAA
jgi:hypothetical protein